MKIVSIIAARGRNCRDITVRLEIALSSASAGVFAVRIKVGWLRTASGFFTAEGDTGRVSRCVCTVLAALLSHVLVSDG